MDPEPLGPATDCWFLTGATATGKSAVGLELAQRLDAEILSLDSMAVYRGMDIGTAKPTRQQRQQLPHHLLDLVDPVDDFSLAEYLTRAHQVLKETRQRKKQALFVGGTPLYLKALLRGLYQGPPADWEFREAIEEELAQVGLEALHQRLWQVDPLLAAKLHPSDKRRIIRALEVYKCTGIPLGHRQIQFEEGQSADSCRVFVLSRPRPVLHERIQQRVESMFARGLLNEVQGLRQRYCRLSRTATQAVGYRESLEHLSGQRDLPSARSRMLARTRQFARRQETWFRSLSECRFIDVGHDEDVGRVAERILEAVFP